MSAITRYVWRVYAITSGMAGRQVLAAGLLRHYGHYYVSCRFR